MKALRNLSVALILVSVGFPCKDPRLQKAVIGGDMIAGTAFRKPKHLLRSAQVNLYLADRRVWTGVTDKNGGFMISHLEPGTYKLSVSGWGSAEVELKPELSMLRNGQRLAYSLMLIEDTCIAVTTVTN